MGNHGVENQSSRKSGRLWIQAESVVWPTQNSMLATVSLGREGSQDRLLTKKISTMMAK